jgi:hypothetical protein
VHEAATAAADASQAAVSGVQSKFYRHAAWRSLLFDHLPNARPSGSLGEGGKISLSRSIMPGMVSLTDSQLAIVTDAARMVPVERRDIFLQRCGAMLKLRGRFTDDDVSDVAQLALAGLIQTAAWANRKPAGALIGPSGYLGMGRDSRFGSSHDRPSPVCWDDTFQKVPYFISLHEIGPAPSAWSAAPKIS